MRKKRTGEETASSGRRENKGVELRLPICL